MTRQLNIFDSNNSFDRIQRDFLKFHADNPVIYKTLHELALFVLATGRKSYGIKSLWERMRWHFEFEVSGPAEFKLNNNYTAHYARMLMEREPRLAGFFDTRELISKRRT